MRNDPVRLESWLRHKAQQRGLNFDSDYKNYIYQWKELAEHMKSMGFITNEGNPILVEAKYHLQERKEFFI